jgi:hypothetical protein
VESIYSAVRTEFLYNMDSVYSAVRTEFLYNMDSVYSAVRTEFLYNMDSSLPQSVQRRPTDRVSIFGREKSFFCTSDCPGWPWETSRCPALFPGE